MTLGVIGAGTSTAEWQDLQTALKQTPEELAMGPRTGLGIAKAGIERAFEAADNAPKIRFFYAEEAALKKAGYSAEEAESLASDRTRDLMPMTERMAPALKLFRRQPVLGNYFSFRAEVIRTFGNRLRLIAEEALLGRVHTLMVAADKVRRLGFSGITRNLEGGDGK